MTTLKLKGDWAKLAKRLDPSRFKSEDLPKIDRAFKEIAEDVAKAARSFSGEAANAPMTIFIKGHGDVGRDKGDLRKAIKVVRFGNASYWVGVRKSDPNYPKAMILHKGATIRVTPKMRALFDVLAHVSNGTASPSSLRGRARELWRRRPRGWRPLSQSTKRLVIKPRPFMKTAEASVNVKRRVQAALRKILQRG